MIFLSTKILLICFGLLITGQSGVTQAPKVTITPAYTGKQMGPTGWEPNMTLKRGTLPKQFLPPRPFRVEGCDNLAVYCFKAFTTGRVCGRTIQSQFQFKKYQDFKNICELDFLNCSEGFEVWTIAHMGACMQDKKTFYYPGRFEYYEYMDDAFLNYNYAIRE